MTITLFFNTKKRMKTFIASVSLVFFTLIIAGCGGPQQTASVEKTENGITVILPDEIEMIFVEIPAGAFTMGSPDDEKDRDDDENPQHKVTLSKPFYLGQFEVTQNQWTAIMPSNPSKYQNSDHPVDSVLWDDCQRFIDKLNSLGVGTFRLPTEAEWEYACRAKTSTRYYWGDDPHFVDMVDHAWFDYNSGRSTHPVGSKRPNPWGLYDMSGNVNEWCLDHYAPYTAAPKTDPLVDQGSLRIKRGGGFFDFSWNARSAARNPETDPSRLELLGLRVVREMK